MAMRILITGGGGQLAADLQLALQSHEVTALPRAKLDIRSRDQMEAALDAFRPDAVINTAAFHDVDLCESEPEHSFLVNAAAVQRLARLCEERGAVFVHYSTDYVFDGAQRCPYHEHDPVNPLSVYGASKAAGEMAVRAASERHLIIRTTGLYGRAGTATRRGNFVETMLRLGRAGHTVRVVSDQVLTPTCTVDVAATTRLLLEARAGGTFHVTNAGKCSWFEFAREIFHLAHLPVQLEPATLAEFASPARRPCYSVLAGLELDQKGFPGLRHWREALSDYLTPTRNGAT